MVLKALLSLGIVADVAITLVAIYGYGAFEANPIARLNIPLFSILNLLGAGLIAAFPLRMLPKPVLALWGCGAVARWAAVINNAVILATLMQVRA